MYRWSGGDGNGRPIANYRISIDGGAWQAEGPNPGSTSVGYGYSQTHTLPVRLVDTVRPPGASSPTYSATTVAAPPPTISISRGASRSPDSNCNNSSCAYVNVVMTNFSPNTAYLLASCDNGNCSGNYSFTTDGSGSRKINNFFYFGYPGHTATVRTTSGVASNGVVW